jgi:glycosyltransferase involved in cell wall biosynthesis
MAGPFDIARRLVERGHRITIFASSYSHYKFRELHLQGTEQWRIETYKGVQFIWLRTFPYWRNDWRRVVNMLTYTARALWVGAHLRERPDVIIGVTVHPLAGLSAYVLSLVKRAQFCFEVRDLWPLALIELGRLSKQSPIAWIMKRLETFLYRKAKKIITLWPHMDLYVESCGVTKDKCVWVPHNIHLPRYAGLCPYAGGTSAPFKIFYMGGYVDQFALDVVLRAAKIIEDGRLAVVRFVLVGGGQGKREIVRLAKTLQLSTVEFRDVVPREGMVRIMNEADAFILCIRNLPGLYRYGVSFNKLCDYLVSGRPVIFAGSPAYNPVKEARAGFVVPPEDQYGVAEAVAKLTYLSPDERIRMGRNGSLFAREHFDNAKLATTLESVLESTVPQDRS